MTLFDLAVKNIRRNMKNYSLYIGSMIFSIVIYFTFVTLKYSDDVSTLTGSSMKMEGLMNAASIILLIFVAIFIAYSNAFFMKRRKKEVALYSLLGVRKKKIGLLLFFENLIIGIFSLVVGILLGFLLSKVFLTILVRLMGFDVVAGFALSGDAIQNTLIVFAVIFLFTSLQGYRVIYRFKLIELFQADKKGEDFPKARWIVALLGVITLGGGYWLAAQDMLTSEAWRMLGYLTTPIVIILLTVAGTYLLFHSVLVFVLTKLKNKEGWSWRGLNMLTVSQLLYRIRGNAKTLTIIAILSATTITAGGAVFSLYYSTEQDAKAYYPHTFMWQGEPQTIDAEDVIYSVSMPTKEVPSQVDGKEYQYTTISVSDFNKVAEVQARGSIELSDEQVAIIDAFYDERFSTDYLNTTVTVEQTPLQVKEHLKVPYFNIDLVGTVMVVSDAKYQSLAGEQITYQMVELDNEKDQIATSNALQKQLGETQLSSFPQSYQSSMESLGSLLFVGTFLGLVFLVATGSIIYFKMMTEAEEDRSKYEILHKIGVNEKEMKRTIRGQVAVIFAVPLAVGLLHSAFALMAFSNLFNMDMLQPVLIWMAAYGAIYMVYYFLTVAYFNKTIQQNF